MAHDDEKRQKRLPGVGDEAVGHMERLQAVMYQDGSGAVVQRVSIEVIPGRADSSGLWYGGALYASGAIPERPRRRLTIEWEEEV